MSEANLKGILVAERGCDQIIISSDSMSSGRRRCVGGAARLQNQQSVFLVAGDLREMWQPLSRSSQSRDPGEPSVSWVSVHPHRIALMLSYGE